MGCSRPRRERNGAVTQGRSTRGAAGARGHPLARHLAARSVASAAPRHPGRTPTRRRVPAGRSGAPLGPPGRPERRLDNPRSKSHHGAVGLVLDTLRLALTIGAIWFAVAVLLSLPLSALFRAQERLHARWREAERRRMWLEATR